MLYPTQRTSEVCRWNIAIRDIERGDYVIPRGHALRV